MAYDHNVISLVGRLTRDIQLQYTNQGKPYAKFGIANNPSSKDDPALFLDVTIWGQQAENAQQYLAKGDQVAVSGTLKQSDYTDRQGVQRTSYEINGQSVMYLQKVDRGGQQPQQQYQQPPSPTQPPQQQYQQPPQQQYQQPPPQQPPPQQPPPQQPPPQQQPPQQQGYSAPNTGYQQPRYNNANTHDEIRQEVKEENPVPLPF